MVTQILVSCDTCRSIYWIWEHKDTGRVLRPYNGSGG